MSVNFSLVGWLLINAGIVCAGSSPVTVDLEDPLAEDFSPMDRIVGGEVMEEKVSYMVSINAPSYGAFGVHYCGGTLISKEWVLTAAHCLQDYGRQALYHTVEIGQSSQYSSDDMHTSGISQITCHEDYDGYYLQNDICLLKLSTPAPDSIPVARLNTDPEIPAVGTPVSYIGWGLMSENGMRLPNELRGVSVDIIDTTLCRRVYGPLVTSKNICTYKLGKDSCQGDSGGPLIVPGPDGTLSSGTVVGVVSFGEGCARRNYPGVNSRTSFFKEWIDGVMTGDIAGNTANVPPASPNVNDADDVAVPDPNPPSANPGLPAITVVYVNEENPNITGDNGEEVVSVVSSEDVSIWDIFSGMLNDLLLNDLFFRSAKLMDRAQIQNSIEKLADMQGQIAAELGMLKKKLDETEAR